MSIKKIATAVVITLGLVASAQAGNLVAGDKSITTDLCMTAASGNRAAMHNSIRASGYSSEFVLNNVECNGDNLLSFIEQNGKNSDAMLRVLDRTSTSVSITDIAKNTIEVK